MNKQTLDEYERKLLSARYEDHSELQRLCLELLEIAEYEDHIQGKTLAYTYLIIYYVSTNQMKEAQVCMITALNLTKISSTKHEKLALYLQCGAFYHYNFDDNTSLEYYSKGLQLADELSDFAMKSRILNNVAIVFHVHNDFKQSLHYYEEALFYAKKISFIEAKDHHCFNIIANIITTELILQDVDKACEYFEESCMYNRNDDSLLMKTVEAGLAHAQHEDETTICLIDEIIQHPELNKLDMQTIFSIYVDLFHILLDRKDQQRLQLILERLKASSNQENEKELLHVHKLYIKYGTMFPEDVDAFHLLKVYYELSESIIMRKDELLTSVFHDKTLLNHMFQINKDLQQKVVRDVVSGLRNRHSYQHELSQFMNDKNTVSIGIIMLDIDDFKICNDENGHLYGDEILRKFGTILNDHATKERVPYRFGGDEFLWIMINHSDDDIHDFLTTIYQVIEECNTCLSVSAGFSNVNRNAITNLSDVVKDADTALYVAKEKGKNIFVNYRNVNKQN